MSKNKREGIGNNENIGVSLKDNVAKKGGIGRNIFSGDIQKLEEFTGNNKESVNSPQKMAENKDEMDLNKSVDVIHAEMQSERNVDENKSNKTNAKDSGISACDHQATDQSVEKSQKKRKRRRGKSKADTSEIGVFTSAECERHERNSSYSVNDKVSNWREMIAARISELEAEKSSKSDTDLPLMFNKNGNIYIRKNKNISPPAKEERKVTFKIEGENKQYIISKGKKTVVLAKKIQADCSIRPVIYMADKNTQTDPLPEFRSKSNSDAKSSTTLNLDSDNTIIIEATESTLPLSTDETESVLSLSTDETESVLSLSTEVTESALSFSTEATEPALSFSTDAIESALSFSTEATKSALSLTTEATESALPISNEATESALLLSDEATESTLPLSAEATNLEIISENVDVSEKELGSSSYLRCVDERLQSITEDFMRNLKISSENFEEGFIKYIKIE